MICYVPAEACECAGQCLQNLTGYFTETGGLMLVKGCETISYVPTETAIIGTILAVIAGGLIAGLAWGLLS